MGFAIDYSFVATIGNTSHIFKALMEVMNTVL